MLLRPKSPLECFKKGYSVVESTSTSCFGRCCQDAVGIELVFEQALISFNNGVKAYNKNSSSVFEILF